ncbi:condensation domain-containing protein [Streptomyces sp. NPDC053253]|uniref:condensation domain-containing protein n=1 Tax=Streptomyces sp. NPDC053253 TaxID=3365699 RepID=UPI0037CDE4D3
MFESIASLQEESWLIWFKETGRMGSPFPVISSWELDGVIDESALGDALYALALRHEALRRNFPCLLSDPTKAWVSSEVVVPLSVVESSDCKEVTRRDLLKSLEKPFDVRMAPLWRVVLVLDGNQHSYLGISMDHTICDGLSIELFLRELSIAYTSVRAGGPVGLGPAPIAYSQLARQQRLDFIGPWGHERRAFWEECVRAQGKYPPECHLARPKSAREKVISCSRSIAVHVGTKGMRLEETRRQWRVTRFALLASAVLAAMGDLLEESRVGLTLDFHGRLLPGAATTFGLFSHGAPLYVDLIGRSDARAHAVAVMESLVKILKYGLPLKASGRQWGVDLEQSDGLPSVYVKINSDKRATTFQFDRLSARLCKLRPPNSERSVSSRSQLDLEIVESLQGLSIDAHFDETFYSVGIVHELLRRISERIGGLVVG